MNIRQLAAAIAILSLAACAGGMQTTPQSSSKPDSHSKGSVTFSITVPKAKAPHSAHHGRPAFVSPNTESVVVQQLDTSSNHNPVGSPVIVNVTSTSNGCTTNVNGTTCSVTFAASAGTFDFSVKTYSQTDAGGSLLSENTLTSFTVIAAQANTITVTLNGVIASVSTTSSISGNLTSPQTLDFTPEDATGATIIGPGAYDNGPLTIADTGGLVTVTPASFSGPGDGTSASVQCNNPGTGMLQLADASGNLSSVSYACTAETLSIAPGSLDFDTVASSSSDSTYDQGVTATDPNPSPTITWNLSCTPSGVASVNGSGASVTIRPLTVGACTLYASDQYMQSQTINIEVHTTNIVINSRRHRSH